LTKMRALLISKLAIAMIWLFVAGLLITPAKSQAPTPPPPQWQIDAGGQAKFETASIKQEKPGDNGPQAHSNIPFGADDLYASTGGLFSAGGLTVINYINFAYKAPYQFLLPEPFGRKVLGVQRNLPKWATTEHFEIDARAKGNPTKDEMRLMLQSLLVDRFQLKVHWETRQVPVYDIVLVRSGKTGPRLRPHADDPPCGAAPGTGSDAVNATAEEVPGGFPAFCGAIERSLAKCPSGRYCWGGRNLSLAVIATMFLQCCSPDFDRPILDKTGLKGNFDFAIEWSSTSLEGPGSTFRPDPAAPTIVEAMKDQLGFKLVPETGSIDVLVVDHIEEPSPN
jgi:uncharacterized protein (TIGR03435 family)